MIGAFGPAAIIIATVALLSICFGFVLLRLIQAMLVDQTVDAAEAVILVLLVSAVMASVILSWGHLTMLIGPLVGSGLAVGWTTFLKLHERHGETRHISAKEEKAWSILERDPTATVAMEQLAAIMEQEGRDESLLGVLEMWQKQEPANRTLARKIRETRARLGLAEPLDPAETGEMSPEPARLTGDDDEDHLVRAGT